MIIFPFLRPANGIGDTPPLPYYLYCLVGIAVLMLGVLYWAIWKLVLPYVFKFRLVARKEVLKDGTVVSHTGESQQPLPFTFVVRGIGADRDSVLSRKGRLTRNLCGVTIQDL